LSLEPPLSTRPGLRGKGEGELRKEKMYLPINSKCVRICLTLFKKIREINLLFSAREREVQRMNERIIIDPEIQTANL